MAAIKPADPSQRNKACLLVLVQSLEEFPELLAGCIGAAVLFDVQTGKELQRLDKSDWIHCAALSPDATQILTGADAPTENRTPLMRLWDAKTGQEIRRFAGHNYYRFRQ